MLNAVRQESSGPIHISAQNPYLQYTQMTDICGRPEQELTQTVQPASRTYLDPMFAPLYLTNYDHQHHNNQAQAQVQPAWAQPTLPAIGFQPLHDIPNHVPKYERNTHSGTPSGQQGDHQDGAPIIGCSSQYWSP